MWRPRKGGHWRWSGEVLSGWSSDSPIREGVVGRSSEKECRCVCMGCLWNTRPRSKFHLSSSECQSIHHSEKAATSALVQGTCRGCQSEVTKLKQAGAIKEVFYPHWLANTVVVKKKIGKWRVCVDFTNLNRACPKDPFPIPRID